MVLTLADVFLARATRMLRSARPIPAPASRIPDPHPLIPRSASLIPRSASLIPRSASLIPRSARLDPEPARRIPGSTVPIPGSATRIRGSAALIAPSTSVDVDRHSRYPYRAVPHPGFANAREARTTKNWHRPRRSRDAQRGERRSTIAIPPLAGPGTSLAGPGRPLAEPISARTALCPVLALGMRYAPVRGLTLASVFL